ncbi:MAG TPA: hypothetical protein VI111_04720 [Thermoleophilaceae bacterium]
MRLGVVWDENVGAYYRAIEPMLEMERQGHTVVWPADEAGDADARQLAGCDLVHVYRRSDPETRRVLTELEHAGRAITWDNDYDPINVPEESPNYVHLNGLGGRRFFGQQLSVARLAQTVTTPSAYLSERFREAGLAQVETVENYLSAEHMREPEPHDATVIGWVAGPEHRANLSRLPIASALRRILSDYPGVRVECIGIDLALGERYRHHPEVQFNELPTRIRAFDVGIAPLADIPFNYSRSAIKLLEYAAAGVPWLASPVGPYATLGVEQGGRLVTNDQWYEALRWMIVKERQRKLLAENAARWAQSRTMRRATLQWEGIFSNSVGARQARAR